MMDDEHLCIACGAGLAGPFQPKITLNRPPEQENDAEPARVSAHAWICPGCGLVHWYTGDEDLAKLLDADVAIEPLEATPGQGYERRSQMLRMLRRVRRM
jgi:hypothetical protein